MSEVLEFRRNPLFGYFFLAGSIGWGFVALVNLLALRDAPSGALNVVASCLAGALAVVWRSPYVRLTESDFALNTPFRPRVVSWTEVATVRCVGTNVVDLVLHNGATVRLMLSFVARSERAGLVPALRARLVTRTV